MTFLEVFDRTYNNCVFYSDKGNNKALLNEIGVLRGIVYCIDEIVGEDNTPATLCLERWQNFLKMIDLQNFLKEYNNK